MARAKIWIVLFQRFKRKIISKQEIFKGCNYTHAVNIPRVMKYVIKVSITLLVLEYPGLNGYVVCCMDFILTVSARSRCPCLYVGRNKD